MPHISVDLKEINRLIDHLKKLASYSSITLKQSDEQYSTEYFELNEMDEKVYDFIVKNPGTVKQNVVDNLGSGSRVPIFKAIKRLINYDLIQVTKDSRNRHHLYVKETNIVAPTLTEIERFSVAFAKLVKRVKETYSLERNNQSSSKFHNSVISLLNIYRHFIGMCLASAIILWTPKIKDKGMLNRLFAIMLTKVVEVQNSFSQVMLVDGVGARSQVAFDRIFLDYLFELKPHKLSALIVNLNENGLIRHAKPTLDSLWNLSGPFLPSYISILHHDPEPKSEKDKKWYIREFGNWQDLAKRYKSDLDPH